MKTMFFWMGMIATGCANQMYQRQSVQLDAPKAVLVKAVEYVMLSQGFEVVSVSEETGFVEARHTFEEDVVDMREHWYFFVEDNKVTIERKFEARFASDEPWQSTDEVCQTYGYNWEHFQFARISEVLDAPLVARR